MTLPSLPHPRRAHGFSLAELLVALAIGLLILAGMTTLFVNNSRAQAEIEKANRQVENGRFGIEVLAGDLRNAGFYGEFDPTVLDTPAALPDPCAASVASLKAALPLHVQGYDGPSASLLGCLSDLRSGTDVLVVRHTRTCLAGDAECDAGAGGGPYFQASLCNNASELDSANPANFYALDLTVDALTRHQRDCGPAPGSGTLAVARRYLTHIYFIANNDKSGDAIPTLKRAELGITDGVPGFTIVPLVEGIENLQLEYGVDTSGDGVADLFSASPSDANGCSADACAATNWRNVVSVKLNLLARNTEPTQGFTDNKVYHLGSTVVAAANDHFKRHAFESLVGLPNPTGRKQP